MNPEQLLARLKTLRASFTTWQLASMAAAFVVVVGGLVLATRWIATPEYRLLFSDLDAGSASAVVERLQTQRVPYELVEGGTGVRVPADRIDQLRLEFAGQGLPSAGRIGFELFEGTNFGWTEFLEQVNYRRALEGELARTITTIEEIAGARVHIAMGQKALFARDRSPAKASVTLKLRGRRPLAPETVTGIRNLVAFAIDDLQPEAVVVMDDRGRPLASAGDDLSPTGPATLEAKNMLEEQVARSIGAMLEPLVGADRYRVRVSALIHHETQDVVAETYGRDGAVRSEERLIETSGTGAGTAAGIAGARANLPESPAPGSTVADPPATVVQASTGTAGGQQRSQERRNYELDRTTTRTVRPRGGLARLSVAVLIDNASEIAPGPDGTMTRTSKPRDPAFMQQVSDLAARAAGLDTQRGDVLTVQNIAFETVQDDVPDARSADWAQRLWPLWIGAAVAAVLALLGGAGALLARRGWRRKASTSVVAQVLPQQQLPRTIQEIEGEIEAQLDAEAAVRAADRKMPVLTKRVTGLVQNDPEAAARLVRSWLMEEKKA